MTKRERSRRRIEKWALALQAKRPPLPPSLRRAGRGMLRGLTTSGRPPVALESWDAPLVSSSGSSSYGPSAPQPARLPRNVRPAVTDIQSGPRCLILTDVLDTGGLDEFAVFLARSLPSRGIATFVAKTGVTGGRLAEDLRSEGVSVHETPQVAALEHLLRTDRPDVISAHAPPDWALEVAARLGVPVVETLHGAPTPMGTNWELEPERADRITAFVAVSELVRRQYLRGNPQFPACGVVVIPNGFDGSNRPDADRERSRAWLGLHDEFLFVSMARLTMEKNTYGLISAFGDVAVQHPESHLLVAGRIDDATYARQVDRLRSSMPTEIRQRIHLRADTSHVPAVLAAADGFVLDSFYEGWCLASMEGLAAGIPVVRSETGGALEQVGSAGRRGYVVDNPLGDPEVVDWPKMARARFAEQPNRTELARAMSDLVTNRVHWSSRRESLAAESRRIFSLEKCAVRHAAVLSHAAGSRGASDFQDFELPTPPDEPSSIPTPE